MLNNQKILLITELNDCLRGLDVVKREVFTIRPGSKSGYTKGDKALFKLDNRNIRKFRLIELDKLRFLNEEDDKKD